MHFLLKEVYLKKEEVETRRYRLLEWLLLCSTLRMLLVDLPLQMVLSSVTCALKAYQLSSKKSPF